MINQVRDERIVVSTIWTYYDLIKFIRDNEPSYKFFEIPSIVDGKPSYPRRFPMEVLDSLRSTLGSYMFSSQYMNVSIPAERQVFKPAWVSYYDSEPEKGDRLVTVDPAISKREHAHFATVLGARREKGEIWVLHYERGHWSPNELIDKTFSLAKMVGTNKVRIESNAYQAALVYGIKDEMKKRGITLRVEEVKAKAPKEQRILALQPFAENGQLHIKRTHRVLEQEMMDFPHGATDDVLDCLAWQVPGMQLSVRKADEKRVERRMLPTFGEMLGGLLKKGKSKLPFENQLGEDYGYFQ